MAPFYYYYLFYFIFYKMASILQNSCVIKNFLIKVLLSVKEISINLKDKEETRLKYINRNAKRTTYLHFYSKNNCI